MSNCCDLIQDKKSRVGNSVSHSNIKTKRMFHVNLQKVKLYSNIIGITFPLKLATRTLKTISKYGNLDEFLQKVKHRNLTEKAKKIKSSILKKKLNSENKTSV